MEGAGDVQVFVLQISSRKTPHDHLQFLHPRYDFNPTEMSCANPLFYAYRWPRNFLCLLWNTSEATFFPNDLSSLVRSSPMKNPLTAATHAPLVGRR
jgi:hypothetical protein